MDGQMRRGPSQQARALIAMAGILEKRPLQRGEAERLLKQVYPNENPSNFRKLVDDWTSTDHKVLLQLAKLKMLQNREGQALLGGRNIVAVTREELKRARR